jgi:chemotaxis protein MotB
MIRFAQGKFQGVLGLVSLSLVSGCVSAGKYKELEGSHQATQQSLAASEARVSELEGKLGIASTEKKSLEASVAEMKTALEELQKRKAETDKRLADFRELTSKFKTLVDSGKLTVRVINGKMVVALSTDVLFPVGSARLSPEGMLAIREVTLLLNDLKDRKYQIEGHTDNVPIHSKTFPSNWELASARAISVLNTMLSAGMPAERVSVAGFGSTQPVSPNETPEGRALNRRIAIVIVPDLTGLPGYEELNRLSATAPLAPTDSMAPKP